MSDEIKNEPLYALVRYRLKPEHIERSRLRAAELYAELAANGPAWLRQASFEMDDNGGDLRQDIEAPMAGLDEVGYRFKRPPSARPSSAIRTYERGRR